MKWNEMKWNGIDLLYNNNKSLLFNFYYRLHSLGVVLQIMF